MSYKSEYLEIPSDVQMVELGEKLKCIVQKLKNSPKIYLNSWLPTGMMLKMVKLFLKEFEPDINLFKKLPINCQELMLAEQLAQSPEAIEVISNYSDVLAQLGFEIDVQRVLLFVSKLM